MMTTNLGGPMIRVQISLSKHHVVLCSRLPGLCVGRGNQINGTAFSPMLSRVGQI